MSNNNHPITPPPELVQEWVVNTFHYNLKEKLIEAARWGADCELEACCEWLEQLQPQGDVLAEQLREGRRPKPLSLRAALQELVEEISDVNQYKPPGVLRAIEDARRALEALPDV